MKILFITLVSIELNTSATIGNISLIKGFLRNGHKVTVLSPYPLKQSVFYDGEIFVHKNLKYVYFGQKNSKKTMNNKKNNTILKNMKKIYNYFSLFGRYKYYSKYSKDVPSKIESYYDLIVTSSDPKYTHIFFKKIKNNICFGKWLQIWGDPLLKDITRKSYIPNFIVKRVELNILKSADKIMYVSPFTLKEQKRIFPNIKDKMFFSPLPYMKRKIYRKFKNDKIKLGYFGNYNKSIRNIFPLYNAIKNNNKYHLIIAGDSDYNLENTSNIEIFPRLSRKKIDELEKSCDILVALTNNKGYQIPAKINYYSGTNKKILIIIDNNYEDFSKYFSKFNRFFISKNSEKDIIQVLECMDKENIRSLPLEEFSSEYVTSKIVKIINGSE